VSLALIAGLFIFVFPTRSYLSQRSDVNHARARLDVLRAENARLEQETTKLADPAEVERIARERFGLVRPGERAFTVVPAPPPPAPVTTTTAPASPGR
jgi:cell division protein FtsB